MALTYFSSTVSVMSAAMIDVTAADRHHRLVRDHILYDYAVGDLPGKPCA
jgi:hypothetical protein